MKALLKGKHVLKDGRGGTPCAVCDKTVDLAKGVQLELSATSGHYFKPEEFPKDEESQGIFWLGSDCAKKELRQTKSYLYPPIYKKP